MYPVVLSEGVYTSGARFIKVAIELREKGIACCGKPVNVQAVYAICYCLEYFRVELEVVPQVGAREVIGCSVVRRFYVLDNEAAVMQL